MATGKFKGWKQVYREDSPRSGSAMIVKITFEVNGGEYHSAVCVVTDAPIAHIEISHASDVIDPYDNVPFEEQ